MEVFVFHYQENEDGTEDFWAVEDEALFAKISKLAEPILEGEDEE